MKNQTKWLVNESETVKQLSEEKLHFLDGFFDARVRSDGAVHDRLI